MNLIVSIIIPSYNRADLISETLDSIAQQTYMDWECFIIDDGSTDETENILNAYIKKDKRFTFLKRPKIRPKGANACRNYGFEKSKGDYILFIDSDDVLTSTCLENRLHLFKTNTNIDFVIANTALLSDGKYKTKVLNKDPLNASIKDYYSSFLSYELPWTSTLSVLWKRHVVNSNPFDEQLLRFQDVDYHISVLRNNFVFERLHVIDNYYRVDPNKIHDKQHIVAVLNNLLIFFNKHASSILPHNNDKLAFRKFINNFLHNYIFPNYHTFREEAELLLKSIYKSKLYTNKQLFLIKSQAFMFRTKLIKTKHIGMFRLNNFIKKTFENS